jgi:heme exporter protein C
MSSRSHGLVLASPNLVQRSNLAFNVLLATTAAVFFYLIYFVFLRVPAAQLQAGGLAQKIFYFHAPSGYAMYLSGAVCFLASAVYLARPSDRANAWAKAGAECAVVFGMMLLTSGPLWAKKAWGVYWTWDPRLTTSLLSLLVYAAIVMLRTFAGEGNAERKFAAALGVLGTANLPIIHYSVKKWGGNHPTVITSGGGGLGHPSMTQALMLGFLAMTLLALVLNWCRARVALLDSRLARLQEQALAGGDDD